MKSPSLRNLNLRHPPGSLWRKILGGIALFVALAFARFGYGAHNPAARPFSERALKVKQAIDQMAPGEQATVPPVMQWGNWGNWNNWQDWGNWNNWNNWANWFNW